ncbi:hypothetical protein CC78DRAFT_572775 [Lojkania enalia]|uniref:BTB domain-containing protein n=1 Tax=Lojkania enalia TaxID=147567 RepID=A0A9P4K1Z4_9PLEO|nr:hypothetical protein CC78DRAFT_572775 [Didymosphaeria enalia]
MAFYSINGRMGGTPNQNHFAKYYNSTNLSDITIVYGIEGKKRFQGHRMVLSSKSKWFSNAFEGRFREANSSEITLKDDDTQAVRSMLEYCYTNDYLSSEHNRDGREDRGVYLAYCKTAMLHHLHVMVVADKYVVDGLVDEAYKRFSSSVCEDIDVHRSAVKHLFQRENIIQATVDETSRYQHLVRSFYGVIRRLASLFFQCFTPFPRTKLKLSKTRLEDAPPLERAKALVVARAALLCKANAPMEHFDYVREVSKEYPAFGIAILDKTLKDRIPLTRNAY